MKCRIFPVRKKEPPNETKTGNAANRDSIKSKVFENWSADRFGEGREMPFFRKGSPRMPFASAYGPSCQSFCAPHRHTPASRSSTHWLASLPAGVTSMAARPWSGTMPLSNT